LRTGPGRSRRRARGPSARIGAARRARRAGRGERARPLPQTLSRSLPLSPALSLSPLRRDGGGHPSEPGRSIRPARSRAGPSGPGHPAGPEPGRAIRAGPSGRPGAGQVHPGLAIRPAGSRAGSSGPGHPAGPEPGRAIRAGPSGRPGSASRIRGPRIRDSASRSRILGSESARLRFLDPSQRDSDS
jgi:hypothetical protein